jgi:hypothetical protein
MQSRAEITGQFAHQYVVSAKKEKGLILDGVVAVTGWSRDNARRQLVAAAKTSLNPSGDKNCTRRQTVNKRPRKRREPKYTYSALKILQFVWQSSGRQCGKYLVVSMPLMLAALERHHELPDRESRYTPEVKAELLSMSAATIDRYLKPIKTRPEIRGFSTTKPSPLLRSSIQVRKAGDEVGSEPGFFEVDTVAHCGPTLKGEFQRSVNLTDVLTGWVFTWSIRNNAQKHVKRALQLAVEGIPYQVIGMDFDNGSEFINYTIAEWADKLDIFFTRSRPYKKNDQATIESKNGHLVRHYAEYWRYDTEETLRLLNRLWPLVNDRLNFLTPTKKPVKWDEGKGGKKRRIYDSPATPLDRLLRAGILSPTQEQQLIAYRDSLNPVRIDRQIRAIQNRLIRLAAPRTEELRRTIKEPIKQDVTQGVQLRLVA